MHSSKLKWYDWISRNDVPALILGIKFFDGEVMMFNASSPRRLECANYWMKEPDSGVIDVIAYTLGEEIEEQGSIKLKVEEKGEIETTDQQSQVATMTKGDKIRIRPTFKAISESDTVEIEPLEGGE